MNTNTNTITNTKNLFSTDASSSSLVLRLALGLVMLPHGAQKLLGWFGGYGFSGTMQFFTETMGLPSVIALLVILLEFFGAALLIAGAFTRLASIGLAGVMIGAAATTHWQHGFFMNWFGAQGGEGIEFHILAVAMFAALAIKGGGLFSLDGVISRWLSEGSPAAAHAPVQA